MSLKTQYEETLTSWQGRVGSGTATSFAADIENLRSSGILDKALTIDDTIPNTANLRDARNQPFDLLAAIADKPAIITFYRGGWCPYCNLELKAYQTMLPQIRSEGATLIAISPELPDYSLSTAEKNGLAFTVVSDVGGKLAEALGIRFELTDEVQPYYEKAGHALPTRNGDGVWSLPIPATYIVDRGGLILYASIEPDYRKRVEPQDVVEMLGRISSRKAA